MDSRKMGDEHSREKKREMKSEARWDLALEFMFALGGFLVL